MLCDCDGSCCCVQESARCGSVLLPLFADVRSSDDVIALEGQPTGMFAADEHLAGDNPSRGTELCSIVEVMFSLRVLHQVEGNISYIDRMERVAFNALPAALTEDMWGQYSCLKPGRTPSAGPRFCSRGPLLGCFVPGDDKTAATSRCSRMPLSISADVRSSGDVIALAGHNYLSTPNEITAEKSPKRVFGDNENATIYGLGDQFTGVTPCCTANHNQGWCVKGPLLVLMVTFSCFICFLFFIPQHVSMCTHTVPSWYMQGPRLSLSLTPLCAHTLQCKAQAGHVLCLC